jgi:putative transposase
MYKLSKTNNSVFSLRYHLIAVVKYRQKVFLSEALISDLKQMVESISEDFEVEVIEQECGEDQLHLLFRAKPTLLLTKYINILKGHTSRRLREKHKDFLKDKLWGDSFWSPSYFLATCGNVSIDVLQNYITAQRKLQK